MSFQTQVEYEQELSKILDCNNWTKDAHKHYLDLLNRISNGVYLPLSELEGKVWNHLSDMREEKMPLVRKMNTRIVQIICGPHGEMVALDDHSQLWKRHAHSWFYLGDARHSDNITAGEFYRIRSMLV
jgi:hypothetical protein